MNTVLTIFFYGGWTIGISGIGPATTMPANQTEITSDGAGTSFTNTMSKDFGKQKGQ